MNNNRNNTNNNSWKKQMVQHSVNQEPDITYQEVIKYVTISSLERDTVIFPNPGKFTITLAQELRNITSIELIQAIIPNVNSVTNEPYLLLKIDELEDVMISNDRNISDAFALIQLAQPVGGFIHTDKRTYENTTKTFLTPKANLSKLSIQFTNLFGNVFDFKGASVVGDKSIQVTMVFKVVTLEKQREVLNFRSVY
jgi:hypothetical protein